MPPVTPTTTDRRRLRRSVTRLAAAAVAVVATILAATATAGAADRPPGAAPNAVEYHGTFAIIGPNGLCVDVSGANPADGTPIQAWQCGPNNRAQRWSIYRDTTDGKLIFQASGLGNKCMDVGGTSGNINGGRPVVLRGCNGSVGQRWVRAPQGNGTELLLNSLADRINGQFFSLWLGYSSLPVQLGTRTVITRNVAWTFVLQPV